jgi:hypothetical protein
MKLLQIVEPFHRRWSKRDSFPGLHSDSRQLSLSNCKSVRYEYYLFLAFRLLDCLQPTADDDDGLEISFAYIAVLQYIGSHFSHLYLVRSLYFTSFTFHVLRPRSVF